MRHDQPEHRKISQRNMVALPCGAILHMMSPRTLVKDCEDGLATFLEGKGCWRPLNKNDKIGTTVFRAKRQDGAWCYGFSAKEALAYLGIKHESSLDAFIERG